MKRIIKKLLPDFVFLFVVKQKNKQKNKNLHLNNVENKKIAIVKCANSMRYKELKDLAYNAFSGSLDISNYSFYYNPVALIEIPKTMQEYLSLIGAKSRNMNQKALKNGIYCKQFNWNEKLDDIYGINTSSSQRQGREMDKSYKNYPEKVNYPKEDDYSIVHIGAFLEEQLVGYVELYIYGNFSMINRILGNSQYLKLGIMNLMVKECVGYGLNTELKYINYLTMQNKDRNTLSAFKNRVGFREYSLLELR